MLKIDQSFVRDMLSNTQDASIISAIIHLAGSLRIALVAEGVEQEGQADALMAMGCNTMQGYLYARPMALASFWPMLLAGQVPAR